MKRYELSEEDCLKAYESIGGVRIRGFKRQKDFVELSLLDAYEFYTYREVRRCFIKVRIDQLLNFIEVIDKLDEDEKNKVYYNEEFEKLEFRMDSFGCIGMDSYESICLAQYFYCISKRSIELGKRASHLKRLEGEGSPWYSVPKRMLHSKGGRKRGSTGAITEECLWNAQNFDKVAKKCAENDWFYEFHLLCLDYVKVFGKESGLDKKGKQVELFRKLKESGKAN